jgi:hypothetical protein
LFSEAATASVGKEHDGKSLVSSFLEAATASVGKEHDGKSLV